MSRIRNSAKAIIVENGRLLTVRHRDEAGDWYSLPGGGQRYSETLEAALKRECREEIGAEIEVGRLKFVREYIGKHHEFSHKDGDMHQVEFLFESRRTSAGEISMGHEPDATQTGVAWLPIDGLAASRLFPAVLRQLLGNPDSDALYLGDVN